jgi:galactokinase
MTETASFSAERLSAVFQERHGRAPRIFSAPGRINIIGEHTDYSGGLALPAAIDRRCLIAAAPTDGRTLRLSALDFNEEAEIDLDRLVPTGGWSDYIAGVAFVLAEAGLPIAGAELCITSSVPVGAGVSSSAALEVAAALALTALAGARAEGAQIASWAQAAENRFVGVPCGVMDQFASANGVAGSALLLNCATLVSTPVRLPEAARFLLVHSMVRHRLIDGAYAERRQDCEDAAQRLGLDHLADLEPSALPKALLKLPDRIARRCRHVVSETARVRSAVQALETGDLEGLGRLLNQSHESLRDDMEVSVPEVDVLAQTARDVEGVLGARMMGGGFGGCVLVLVRAEAAQGALASITDVYGRKIGEAPIALACAAGDGAREIHL